MGARDRLRQLIDALEARHAVLPEDTTSESFEEDVASILSHDDSSSSGDALNSRIAVSAILEDMLSALRREIGRIRTAPLRAANSRRPAVALPVEILEYIFALACLPVAIDGVGRAYGGEIRRSRSSVLGTCWRWREAALRMTSLWSTIVISLAVKSSLFSVYRLPEHHTNLNIVPLEVARAGSRHITLSLHISSPNAWDTNIEHTVHSIIRRCGALIYTGCESLSPSFLSLLGSESLPQLRTLYIAMLPTAQEGQILDLTKCDSLQSVHLAGHLDRHLAIRYPAEFGVRALTLDDGIEMRSAIGLINACYQLEMLHWTTHFFGSQEPGSPAPLGLKPCPHLSRLCLRGDIPATLIIQFVAPQLSYFKVSQINSYDSRQSIFCLPHTPQFPQLRHFEVDVDDDSDDTLLGFIQAHPRLETLDLLHGFSLPHIARGLVATDDSGSLILPLLKDVWARAERGHPLDLEAAETLLEHRSRAPPNSPSLILHLWDYDGRANPWQELSRKYPGQVLEDVECTPDDWSWTCSAPV